MAPSSSLHDPRPVPAPALLPPAPFHAYRAPGEGGGRACGLPPPLSLRHDLWLQFRAIDHRRITGLEGKNPPAAWVARPADPLTSRPLTSHPLTSARHPLHLIRLFQSFCQFLFPLFSFSCPSPLPYHYPSPLSPTSLFPALHITFSFSLSPFSLILFFCASLVAFLSSSTLLPVEGPPGRTLFALLYAVLLSFAADVLANSKILRSLPLRSPSSFLLTFIRFFPVHVFSPSVTSHPQPIVHT